MLISHLVENKYRESYIRSFKSEIKKILKTEFNQEIQSYDDHYKSYFNNGLSKRALDQRRQTIGLIKQFDCEGKYPSRARRYRLLHIDHYDTLSDEFKKVVDFWELYVAGSGQKTSSIATKRQACISFFSHLNSSGAKAFDEITENMVFNYFINDGKVLRGHTSCYRIRRIIKECMPFFSNNVCKKVFLSIPLIKKSKKNYPYLTEEEAGKIMLILKDEFSGLNYRDRAIGLLALLCGVRSCDIAVLKISDINWEKETINIVQQKTGVPLNLPFCLIVGNAIYDYIMEERPKVVDEDHVFLINDREVRPISRRISHICEKIMTNAGVRSNYGKRGFHLFRHWFGVMLLNKGVPCPVISAALGHVSPASLDAYLDSDLKRLKECGRSIEKFSVGKEVFK